MVLCRTLVFTQLSHFFVIIIPYERGVPMFHTKTKITNYIIAMVCIIAMIAGIVFTPYHANAETVESIAIDQTKTTLQYQVGSTILTSDIFISINGSFDSIQCSTLPDVTIDVIENTAVGRKTVTVSYAGQSTSYTVTVVPRTPTVALLQKLDFDTIKAYTAVQPGVSGINFVARLSGATTFLNMGISTAKTSDGKYFWDSIQFLKPGSTYLYKVRTYADVNGERFYSAWSTEKSYAMPVLYGAERWRPETKRQLLAHGVYSKTRENIIINIIKYESGGNERAGAGRYYVGLLQFGKHWKHNYTSSYFTLHKIYNFQADNRLSGSWSLHRVAHLIKYGGGTNALKTHWPSTWNR
jgi:hypothetical protein